MTIKELFKQNKTPLLSIYLTAGFPDLESMPILLNTLANSGVDFVEIGIPYSDPLCDGPIIQNSNAIALQNGITLDVIFEQLTKSSVALPKIMMGYFNSVLQYGVERFCQKCSKTGISGIILPDLPIQIYLQQYKEIFETSGLSFIFLISPGTSKERIKYIDTHSSSFIYAVSSSSTTGKKKGIQNGSSFLKRLNALSLKHPCMVGFNIHEAKDLEMVARYARGGIIGSAFIDQIGKGNDLKQDVQTFISFITQKTPA